MFAQQARDAFGYEELVADLSDVVGEVAGQSMLSGIQTLRSFDNYLFLHSIDTTVVALMIGRRLGFDRARLHQLAAGCILHDIGMVMVDPVVLHKEGRLEPAELTQLRQHPRLGYDMLRQIRPREVIPNHVAYQHHERQDGTGYPRGLHGSGRITRSELEKHIPGRILLDAEICAVADVYDALGADRAYRAALPPDQIVQTLRGLAGSHLNREVVEKLLEILPIYPLGSEIIVKSGPFAGYRGIVAKVDRRQMDRPLVRLLYDKPGRRIEPVELDLRFDNAIVASGGVTTAASAQPTAARAPVPVPPESLEQSEAARGARVLIVDDDPSIAEVLADALEDAGYVPVQAGSGREALALAGTADIMPLDLGLPDVDGVTVCKALRASPELARLPVMMLTARGEAPDRVRGIQSGADDYLAKPFDINEVLARVEALLRSRQIEQGLRERNRQLDLLRGVVSSLAESGPLGELPQRIVDAIPAAFGQDGGVVGGLISAVDRDRREIQGRAFTAGANGGLALMAKPLSDAPTSYDPARNLQHEVALFGQARASAHLPEFLAPSVPNGLALAIEKSLGMRGAIAYPARAHGRTVGVLLFVLSKPVDMVNQTERTLMSELADAAGVALEDARLHATAG